MNNEEKILEILQQLQDGQAATNARLDSVDARLDTMQDSIDTLKSDMAHHNHYVEPLIKATSEGMSGIQERNKQLDRLDEKVDDHDHRIWALEESVKTLKQA